MIPLHSKDLKASIKNIEIIYITDDIIIWAVPDMGIEITLNKYPLTLELNFNNREQLLKTQALIQKHFEKMSENSPINRDACDKLKNAFCNAHELDGNDIVTYNNMSLLHFFGTWLGPTSNFHAKGHAIMNNLHYELFGFHQYHGKQYYQIKKTEWKHSLNDCGNNCQHDTCLKHAKNSGAYTIVFYKDETCIFSAYLNYLNYFSTRYTKIS